MERRLRNEINRGVQTIQYQVVTLMTTNGQAPFITVFMYLGEARNPQEKAEGSATMEKRCQVSKWTAGVNWFALPNLVVKADYTTRHIGTNKVFGSTKYNNENEFAIGIAYVGWFTKR